MATSEAKAVTHRLNLLFDWHAQFAHVCILIEDYYGE